MDEILINRRITASSPRKTNQEHSAKPIGTLFGKSSFPDISTKKNSQMRRQSRFLGFHCEYVVHQSTSSSDIVLWPDQRSNESSFIYRPFSYSLLIRSWRYWSDFLRFFSDNSWSIAKITAGMEIDFGEVIRSPLFYVSQTTRNGSGGSPEFLYGIFWDVLRGGQTSLGSPGYGDRSRGWCWWVLGWSVFSLIASYISSI